MHTIFGKARRAIVALPFTLALVISGMAAPTAAHASTAVFTSTGAEQIFTVPAGVKSIHVVAIGAPGGAAYITGGDVFGAGGLGARAVADIAVHAGQTLYVEVGGVGGAGEGSGSSAGQGGFNGGGSGGISDDVEGGGGGGASDVRTVAASGGGASLSSRLVVAAGGGGGGYNAESGGAAGKPGQPTCSGCNGGGAGTSSHGGAAGAGNGVGDAGALGVGGGGGGATEESFDGGGGGGGGRYGGGGGGGGGETAGGGGGGSSGFTTGATHTSVHADSTGIPLVTFTYTKTKSTTTSVKVGHSHRSISVSGSVKPAAGGVKIAVTLSRKHGSKYHKVASKHPLLSTSGHYTASFSRPKSGKCEIKVTFPGYREFAASHASKKFSC